MSSSKLQIFVLGCLAILLVAWMTYALSSPRSDEAKYHEMQKNSRCFMAAISAEKGRFGAVVRPLHLPERYMHRFDAERDRLLASGYLTNISISVSNALGRRSQLVGQLDSVTKGTDILICEFSWRSNGVAITGRAQDVARLRQTLESHGYFN